MTEESDRAWVRLMMPAPIFNAPPFNEILSRPPSCPAETSFRILNVLMIRASLSLDRYVDPYEALAWASAGNGGPANRALVEKVGDVLVAVIGGMVPALEWMRQGKGGRELQDRVKALHEKLGFGDNDE